jgi:hypothetical protein
VLVTDANETIGVVRQMAPRIADEGIGVDVVAARRDESVNAAVEKGVVPEVSRHGGASEVRVVIRNEGVATVDQQAAAWQDGCE